MLRLFNKLRIGEKIGLGFGFVCILFLGVIWQHQMTLKRTLSEYQGLLDVFEAKKSFALNIGRFTLAARSAEKNFLIQRKPQYAASVGQYVGQVQAEASKLEKIDLEGLEVGRRISGLIKNYHNRFEAIVAAWQKKDWITTPAYRAPSALLCTNWKPLPDSSRSATFTCNCCRSAGEKRTSA